jgi:hypothetical protein
MLGTGFTVLIMKIILTVLLSFALLSAYPHKSDGELATIYPLVGAKLSLEAPKHSKSMNLLSKEQSAVKRQIQAFFNDVPEMVAIAGCESGFRQFDENGKTVVSKTNDAGLFQINRDYWDKEADQRGLDYENSLEDNMKMARIVYEKQGLTAWVCYKNML